jgi:hypothetical protein
MKDEKVFSRKDIMKKLQGIDPSIKNKKLTNPFIYQDIKNWYNQLKAEIEFIKLKTKHNEQQQRRSTAY